MSGGSCTVRLTTPGGPSGGSRFSRMNIMRTNSSRQTCRGRMSGGGKAWHAPHVARACCSSPCGGGGDCVPEALSARGTGWLEGEKAAAEETGSEPRSRTRDSAAHGPPDEKHEPMLARGHGTRRVTAGSAC